jgi:ABC-type polysaccharide/polyol phosphate export permease
MALEDARRVILRTHFSRLSDLRRSIARVTYLTLFQFLIRYRRTALGPLWLLVGPALFIIALGNLYAHLGVRDPSVFIPHLAIGLTTWTMISGFVTGSTTVFRRGRAQILQGSQSLDGIIGVDVATAVIVFVHQLPIVVAVFLFFGLPLHLAALESLAGLFLIVINGIWLSRFFGILGARYRDLTELVQAAMRMAFLATPIIWMPGEGMRGSTFGAVLVFNPFYHFLEVVRAPLLGQPVQMLSWIVVAGFAVGGTALTRLFFARYSRFVALWV